MNSMTTIQPDLPARCERAFKKSKFDELTLSAQLATLDRIGRQRALTDTESRELERLMRIKDRRDERRGIFPGRKSMEQQPIPRTFAGVPVRAMEDAMAERQKQIADFGHTPEKDLARYQEGQPDHLGRVACRYANEARESMAFGRSQLNVARIKSIKAIAALLAQVDLIDAALAEEPCQEDEA